MLESVYNLETKRGLVEEILGSARAFLAGQVGPIEAARSLVGFQGIDKALDEALRTFVVVESETDDLPVGEVRKLWNESALKRKDVKIIKAESWCREMVTNACRALVAQLEPILDELADQALPRVTRERDRD